MDRQPNDTLDLNRLRARSREKPRTKAGQVRQAWPEIRALFEAGHSLKDICIWLNEIGVEIGYARLSHYTGQLKRRDASAAGLLGTPPAPPLPDSDAWPDRAEPKAEADDRSFFEVGPDPLANVRAREERRQGFQYNPDPDPKKLI